MAVSVTFRLSVVMTLMTLMSSFYGGGGSRSSLVQVMQLRHVFAGLLVSVLRLAVISVCGQK